MSSFYVLDLQCRHTHVSSTEVWTDDLVNDRFEGDRSKTMRRGSFSRLWGVGVGYLEVYTRTQDPEYTSILRQEEITQTGKNEKETA